MDICKEWEPIRALTKFGGVGVRGVVVTGEAADVASALVPLLFPQRAQPCVQLVEAEVGKCIL